jgi:predicted metalloprotease with PDZ domain
MPRSSPGRYAIHEFAKNVYEVEAYDSKGKRLELYRPNPYQWDVAGHDGEVTISYTLFANRADGTYEGINERNAHLNMPATFMFARGLEDRPIEITFDVREDLNWKVATQLKHLEGNRFYAPDMQYFMDSPTIIADWSSRSWEQSGQTIEFVLLHLGTEEELDAYVDQVKKITAEQEAVFGELPQFDFGKYTFLASYNPWVAGDGMEHRNSTILTGNRSLARGGNIGTVSHEFFHAWNVERIRPKALEPFSFEEANMSGELWFAEGFTSYYTSLILKRAGLINEEQYINGLLGGLNAVLNLPGPGIHSVVEMSYQAPFVDAATSIDPVNRANTFVSYYTFGSVLGLGLDLMLRTQFEGLDLDGYMQAVWERFGKPELPYTLQGLEAVLAAYSRDAAFAKDYFSRYIHGKESIDFVPLFREMGIEMKRENADRATLGQVYIDIKDGKATVASDVLRTSPLYGVGISRGAEILSLDGQSLSTPEDLQRILQAHKPGDKVAIAYTQLGMDGEAEITLVGDPNWNLSITASPNPKREAWLASKAGND